MMDFDPNNSAPDDSGLFALPFAIDDAALVIVPVPWDATSSQGWKSAGAPQAVYDASMFVELFDPIYGAFYRKGIAMSSISEEIRSLNAGAIEAQQQAGFHGAALTPACEQVNTIVRDQVDSHIGSARLVGLLGGDHSVSYGAIEAHLAAYPDLGILQIDAHCDLRCAFDDIEYSHASIMYNVLEKLGASSLVQVGVRGLCDFEAGYSRESSKVRTFFDADLHRARSAGETWSSQCARIVETLPDNVYISLDVDGLEPASCPNTGTPVPGGLAYNDALYLLRQIGASGKKVVGFDLVEAGSEPFDAVIAAHLLYQLCGVALSSESKS